MKSPTPIKLVRYLKIHELLRLKYTRHTAVSLAAELEVTDRTIRNDLDFMRNEFNAPIEWTKAKGYHYTDPNWHLPTIPLSEGELFALTLGSRILEGFTGSGYALQLRSAIQKLGDRLPETTWVNLQQVAEDRVLFGAGAKIDLDPQIWSDLERACQQYRSVEMTYSTASREGAKSDRVFDPYLLYIYRGTNPNVIGYCHKRQKILWFRIDRISQLKILDQKFDRDPKFNAQEYLADVFQAEAGGELQEIEVRFDRQTAPYIKERIWHPRQEIIEEEDGGIRLKFVAKGLQEIKRWLLSYGKGAKVINPPELLEIMQIEINAMRDGYLSIDRLSLSTYKG